MTEKDKERFLSKFKQGKPDECWEWLSAKDLCGYGRFGLNGKNSVVHRISYELFKGEIPEGLCVCHTCDNPPCVNPNHLWVGTKKDNNLDKIKKKRGNQPKGKNHPFWGKHRSKETRNKISEARLGQRATEETKEKMRRNHWDNSGENHPLFGKNGENSPNWGNHQSKETRDKISKSQQGENNNLAKLTESQVQKIRVSILTSPELAKIYGVTSSTICNIKKRRIWKYLK